MERWWRGIPGERYWMEITDRSDVGQDLNAPEVDETGKPKWTYDMLVEAEDGDVVFHFHKPSEAIVGHSVVRDPAWRDEVVWGAKGTSARDHDVRPYARPGNRRALLNFELLTSPVSLQQIRDRERDVFAIRDRLEHRFGTPLYFPFVPYAGQPLRTFQGYMVKFPRDLVSLLGLPEGVQAGRGAPPRHDREPEDPHPGSQYRRADEGVAVSRAIPMVPDPSLVDRALRGHRATQNSLADTIESHGLEPRSPGVGDPEWDLAWHRGSTLYIAEVKSLRPENEERQLRLGVGQVLRYRQIESARGAEVRAVLAVERAPTDISWVPLCDSLGIRLVWPDNWETLLFR